MKRNVLMLLVFLASAAPCFAKTLDIKIDQNNKSVAVDGIIFERCSADRIIILTVKTEADYPTWKGTTSGNCDEEGTFRQELTATRVSSNGESTINIGPVHIVIDNKDLFEEFANSLSDLLTSNYSYVRAGLAEYDSVGKTNGFIYLIWTKNEHGHISGGAKPFQK